MSYPVRVIVMDGSQLDDAVSRGVANVPGADESFAGRRVLIKANFNSPHAPPASSDLPFLGAIIRVIRAGGATEIALGDSCGLRWAPAARVFDRLGLPTFARAHDVRLLNFDEGPWRAVETDTGQVRFSEAPFAHDTVVYATCVKTHRAARFSISLKHTVGFLSPQDRYNLHGGDIEDKIAAINAAVRPVLVLADARRCFVAGGPARGWVRRPGVILAGNDRVALDVEGLRILSKFRWINGLSHDPWSHRQVRRAVELQVGVADENQYKVVTD